jgi:hypothetical protein
MSRARARVLAHLGGMTSRTILVSTCSLLSSAVACDPAPPPPICSPSLPTAQGSFVDANTIDIVVVPAQFDVTNPAAFDNVAPGDVTGATILQQSGDNGLKLRLALAQGTTQVTVRAVLECQFATQTAPTYLITVAIPPTHGPVDGLFLEVTKP